MLPVHVATDFKYIKVRSNRHQSGVSSTHTEFEVGHNIRIVLSDDFREPASWHLLTDQIELVLSEVPTQVISAYREASGVDESFVAFYQFHLYAAA
jgi:hypothetical protein